MATIDEELDDAIFGYDGDVTGLDALVALSLIHISEPTRPY